MTSDKWQELDDLMRELGAVRQEADALEVTAGAVDSDMRIRIEKAIAEAADAINSSVEERASHAAIVLAWERIVLARRAVEEIRTTARASRQMMMGSEELRRRALELMETARDRRKRAAHLGEKLDPRT